MKFLTARDNESVNEVISDNQQIFHRISSELLKAERQILVAMAWFTDNDLKAILAAKAKSGLDVQVILSDVPDNEKLDFSDMEAYGAKIFTIKGSGYAKMHHKFCVIDEKLSISGSYNWTMNARRNNHENITVSTIATTVQSYYKIFLGIKV